MVAHGLNSQLLDFHPNVVHYFSTFMKIQLKAMLNIVDFHQRSYAHVEGAHLYCVSLEQLNDLLSFRELN